MISNITLLSAVLESFPEGTKVEVKQLNEITQKCNDIIAIVSRDPVRAERNSGLEAWVNSDDTGMSSMYLLSKLEPSFVLRPTPDYATPHDSSDLVRCINLMDAAPELKENFSALDEDPYWRELLEFWSTVESYFYLRQHEDLSNFIKTLNSKFDR